jgi:GNAT superfamily N-acetyltransferase
LIEIEIVEKKESDKDWIQNTIRSEWYSEMVVIKGKKVRPSEFDALIALKNSGKVGLLTYRITGTQCEILTLNSFIKREGIGSRLIRCLEEKLVLKDCNWLEVTTTNDNIEALAFYQKLGFKIAGIQVNAMEHAREKKPSIPKTGLHGIPIRDEIVLTKNLQKKK